MEPRIGIIGGGSWATALTKLITDNGYQLNWWMRDPKRETFIKKHKHNPDYLRSAVLEISNIHFYTDINAAIDQSHIVIFAVPSAFLAEVCAQIKPASFQNFKVISAIKGMEPESNLILSEYFEKSFKVSPDNYATISGPCHAEEVAQELTAVLTIGSVSEELGEKVAAILKRPNIFTISSTDVKGIEYAAVLKNIYALANGIANGINEGDNFKSVLVSNAAREMKEFLTAIAPAERDTNHSVYLGDLLVTAYSPHSRNRTFGTMIGNGYSTKSAQLELNMIAEGYYAAKSIYKLSSEKGLNMPIAHSVYRILYEKFTADIEFKVLKLSLI